MTYIKKYLALTGICFVSALLLIVCCVAAPCIQQQVWPIVAVVMVIAMWSILALPFVLIGYTWKQSPKFVRIITLVALANLLFFGELYLQKNGHRPGFTCSKNEYEQIPEHMPKEGLVDYQIIVTDNYGVSKFNPHSKQLPGFVNSEGFHSRYEFNQQVIDSLKRLGYITIAAFGDSYTYGNDADSGQSFVDHLNRTGKYAVFNFGIPGVDPSQYVALTREYIASRKLRFDRVVVFICGANDFYPMPGDTVLPGIPVMYTTNMGNFYSTQIADEDSLSAQIAYENFLEENTVYTMPGGSIIGKSVIASQMTGILRSMVIVAVGAPYYLFKWEGFNRVMSFLSVVRDWYSGTSTTLSPFLEIIRKNCAAVGTPVDMILIPGKEMVAEKKCPITPGVINLNSHVLSVSDYNDEGGFAHPNTKAHYEIYLQIKSILDSITSVRE